MPKNSFSIIIGISSIIGSIFAVLAWYVSKAIKMEQDLVNIPRPKLDYLDNTGEVLRVLIFNVGGDADVVFALAHMGKNLFETQTPLSGHSPKDPQHQVNFTLSRKANRKSSTAKTLLLLARNTSGRWYDCNKVVPTVLTTDELQKILSVHSVPFEIFG